MACVPVLRAPATPSHPAPDHPVLAEEPHALVARLIRTANLARASGAHPLALARQGLSRLLEALRADGLPERALEPLVRYIATLD